MSRRGGPDHLSVVVDPVAGVQADAFGDDL